MMKIKAIICVILAVASLTSCGKYSKLYETLDGLVLETVFPEANGGAESITDAKDDVILQQKALCEAMTEAYKLTDIESLRDKHPEINRNKMMSELSQKRQMMNYESETVFVENMRVILEKIDEKDADAYILVCLDEAKSFYRDYDSIVNAANEDYEGVSKIFVTYAFSENNFARHIFIENSDVVIEAATLTIEKNAEEDSSLRANIAKNNEIIKAINEVLGGVYDNEYYRTRINEANRKLLIKTLDSMSSMSEAERNEIIRQFEET